MGFVKKWGLFLLLVFVLVFSFGYVWSFVFGFSVAPFQVSVETRFLPGEYEAFVRRDKWGNTSVLSLEFVLPGKVVVSSFWGGTVVTSNWGLFYPAFVDSQVVSNCSDGSIGFYLAMLPAFNTHRLEHGSYDVGFLFLAMFFNVSWVDLSVSGLIFVFMDYNDELSPSEVLVREYYSELVINGTTAVVRDAGIFKEVNSLGLGDLASFSFEYALFSAFLVKVLDVVFVWGGKYWRKAWAIFSRMYHEFRGKSGSQG